VVVAIDDPRDVMRIDNIRVHFQGHRIDFRVALQDDIARMIDHFFGTGESGLEAVDLDEVIQNIDVGEESASDSEEPTEDDSGICRLVNQIIVQGYQKGASDIHIEPYIEGEVEVRYRIDGDLMMAMKLPTKLRNAIVSRIKIMSELDIAERRKPQDGKIKFRKWGPLDIELRVATVPTVGGLEDVVMRILASSKPIPLDKMGMSERNYNEFISSIDQPYGIVLCVGPTGSGKTTTLHSALGFINDVETKIWTAEDPVEITQKGLRQVQVNRKAGMDFAAIMRSFLRADPDVIMVGEMRDLETTSTGIEASLTGHLVFSTLHTNNAPETVTRLLDMGIDEFSFADALLCVLAQRLGRTLCKECKEEYAATQGEYDILRREYGRDDLWEALGKPFGPDLKLMRRRDGGCSKCNGTGMRGRCGIHELLVNSAEIKDLIYRRAKAEEIRDKAIEEGMRTLKQDGIEKVLSGLTIIEKVREVCSA
jgi:type II secretory ATPase GspE/PulE/Tfp pilus assembly ATPase PilB-like protein